MFDRCWLWRRLLTRRADGNLTAAQWGALEKHLSRCPRCQEAAQGDQALRTVLRTHTGLLDTPSARSFDDRVVAMLRPEQTAAAPVGRFHSETRRTLPFVYLAQIMGGAIAAAAVTALFLVPALHPAPATAHMERRSIAIERSAPPVPLWSLLQTPSPRAALLWTQPHAPNARAAGFHMPATPQAQPVPANRPVPTRQSPSRARQQHSMSDDRMVVGA